MIELAQMAAGCGVVMGLVWLAGCYLGRKNEPDAKDRSKVG